LFQIYSHNKVQYEERFTRLKIPDIEFNIDKSIIAIQVKRTAIFHRNRGEPLFYYFKQINA